MEKEEFLTIEQYNDNCELILDKKTKKLLVRKRVKNGERSVYQWLIDHPDSHLVRILSCDADGDDLIIMEESITGENLEEYLKDKNPDEEEKKRIYLEILDGVDILHHAQPPIIHRDIKVSNIMINEENHPVIIDFDAAKTFKGTRNRDTVLIGTEGSAAPEQYGFAESDERTDIYALGVLAKSMFPDKKDFIKKAMAIDPSARFQNIKQMKKAFTSGRTPYSWIPFDPDKKSSITGFILTMVFFLLLTYVTDINGLSLYEAMVNRFVEFMIFMSLYMLYRKWTPLFKGISWLQSPKMIVRIGGYVFMTIAVFFFWALVASSLLKILR